MRVLVKPLRLALAFFFTFSITIAYLAQSAYPSLFESASWMAVSAGALAQGIGGLEANIDSDLKLQPKDLTYEKGHLTANVSGNPIKIEISPQMLRESLNVVQSTQKTSFEVSQDALAGRGNGNYIEEPLNGTQIGNLFLHADSEFAWMVWEEPSLTKATPKEVRPIYNAQSLLDSDPDYRGLVENWTTPPTSWPQIALTFKPEPTELAGLVSFEYKPQVQFLSVYEHPMEVDSKTRRLGELPYKPLIEDVHAHPEMYRHALPLIDQAASVTAAMGLVNSACKESRSCKHLRRQTWLYTLSHPTANNSVERFSSSSQSSRAISFHAMTSQIADKKSLDIEWLKQGLANIKPGSSIDSWRTAFNAIQKTRSLDADTELSTNLSLMAQTYRQNSQSNSLDSVLSEEIGELHGINARHSGQVWNDIMNIVSVQFEEYEIPEEVEEDNVFQASRAIIDAWNDETAVAEDVLNSSLKKSQNYPEEQYQIADLGLYVGKLIQERNQSSHRGAWIQVRMDYFKHKTQIAAYDIVDNFLKVCMNNPSNKVCNSEKLRTLEANSRRAGLFNYIPQRDVAWLHGRFAYLIGAQLKNDLKDKSSDRLRFLKAYSHSAKLPWHRWKLSNLEKQLKRELNV